MTANAQKKNPKAPDWFCAQDNGECLTETGYKTGTWNPKPGQQRNFPVQKSTPQLVKEDKPDWDAIAEGKVRHGVVTAMLQAKYPKAEILEEAPFWTKFIMEGKEPSDVDIGRIPF
jgi:hypothetical protein